MASVYTLGRLAEAFNDAVDRLLVNDLAAEDAFFVNITRDEDDRLLRTAMQETSPGVFDQKRPGPEDQIARADVYTAVLVRAGREEQLAAFVPYEARLAGTAEDFAPKAPAFAKLIKAAR